MTRAFSKFFIPAILLVTVALLTLSASSQSSSVVIAGVLAQEPVAVEVTTHVLSFQGRLANPTTGEPKADGSYSITFRIYSGATGGTALWTEIKDVTVSRGLFSTLLGDVTPLASTIFNGNDRWLGIKVASDPEATPRLRMAFVPHASWAKNSGALAGQGSAFYRNASNINAGTLADARIPAGISRDSEVMGIVKGADGAGSGLDADLLDAQNSGFYRNASNINAGTLADARIPAGIARNSEVVDVTGDVMSGSATDPILTVTQNGAGGGGYFSSGAGHAVEGVAGAGKGVVGRSTDNNGLFGTSTNGWAIWGEAQYGGIYGSSTAPGSDAIRGQNSATSGSSWGVAGTSVSPTGRGVAGFNTTNSGIAEGVYGYSSSTEGRGVSAYAAASSGVTSGVYAQSVSTGGRGVYGYNSASTGTNYGVYGESKSGTGRGVYGTSPYIGVYGYSSSGGTYSYGVYGYAASPSTNHYAGYFSGNVRVTGTLWKGTDNFEIDHPLDPENKYLYHSVVESPDMMNVYNGNVTLDENGAAWVDLPSYFEALNMDFRYQLTPIGGPGPNLYIAQEVQNNRFQIAGGGPGLRVSWLITGIRHDPFANANRTIVEKDKPAEERGTYLHPEAYGLDRSRGLDHQRGLLLSNEPLQEPTPRTEDLKKTLGDDPSQNQP